MPGVSFGGSGGEHVGVELADERDVSHGVVPCIRGEVEIVHAQSFLENGRVGIAGDGEEHGIVVAHVVPADHIGTVGKAARMLAVRRPQQERRRVDRAAG